jgi:hypothetical protein
MFELSRFVHRIIRPQPPNKILFWGLSRSGNHCVIDWLLSMHQLQHRNNLRMKSTVDQGQLVSLENKDFSKYGAASNVRHILLLRAPFNWLASRIKRYSTSNNSRHYPDLKLWTKYANEFLRQTNYLTNAVLINYNQWFLSESYRRQIARQLNMKYNDETLNRIPQFGRSSFDRSKFRHNAREMEVLNRWQNLSDDHMELFLHLLSTKQEVFDLCKTLFPEQPTDKIQGELRVSLSLHHGSKTRFSQIATEQ